MLTNQGPYRTPDKPKVKKMSDLRKGFNLAGQTILMWILIPLALMLYWLH